MSKWSAVSAICIACCTIVVATTHATNVLTNPGFETDALVGNPPITNLTGWLASGGSHELTSSSPDPAHSGVGSLQLSGSGYFSTPIVLQEFATSPGEAWDFQAYGLITNSLPVNSTFGVILIEWVDASGYLIQPLPGPGAMFGSTAGVQSGHVDSNSPINQWQFLDASGVAPSNTAKVKFAVILLDQNPTKMWFDDLSASIIPEPGSMALAITGLLALGTFIRRRRT